MSTPRRSRVAHLSRQFEAVRILNLDFFALVFSVTYRRKNRLFSIISQVLFVGMYATQRRYNVRVSELKHHYGNAKSECWTSPSEDS
jgi:hypothetical protein